MSRNKTAKLADKCETRRGQLLKSIFNFLIIQNLRLDWLFGVFIPSLGVLSLSIEVCGTDTFELWKKIVAETRRFNLEKPKAHKIKNASSVEVEPSKICYDNDVNSNLVCFQFFSMFLICKFEHVSYFFKFQ